jgi:hypothetical protein
MCDLEALARIGLLCRRGNKNRRISDNWLANYKTGTNSEHVEEAKTRKLTAGTPRDYTQVLRFAQLRKRGFHSAGMLGSDMDAHGR